MSKTTHNYKFVFSLLLIVSPIFSIANAWPIECLLCTTSADNNIGYQPGKKMITLKDDLVKIPATIENILNWSAHHPYQSIVYGAGLYPIMNPVALAGLWAAMGSHFLWKKFCADAKHTFTMDYKGIYNIPDLFDRGDPNAVDYFSNVFKVDSKHKKIFDEAIKNTHSNKDVATEKGAITKINGVDYNVIKSYRGHDFSWVKDGISNCVKGYDGKKVAMISRNV